MTLFSESWENLEGHGHCRIATEALVEPLGASLLPAAAPRADLPTVTLTATCKLPGRETSQSPQMPPSAPADCHKGGALCGQPATRE